MAIVKHVKSVTLADDADTNLVRPSDWNSDHAITCWEGISLGGTTNTQGTKTLISSGTFFLAGSNNISIAKSDNSISFSSVPIYQSSYENVTGAILLNLTLTTTALTADSEYHVGCNFLLNEPMDIKFIRIPAQMILSSKTGAMPVEWGATTVIDAVLYQYFGVGIYTNGTGDSSQSLYSVVTQRESIVSTLSHSRNNSLQTITQVINYPISGSTSQFSTTYSYNSSNVIYQTTGGLTRFAGVKFIDYNINTKLEAGNYWLFAGYNYFYTVGDTNMTSVTNNGPIANNFYGASVLNSNIGIMGNTNVETGGYMFCGDFSTSNATLANPPDEIALSQVSSMASHQRLYFQMIRYN